MPDRKPRHSSTAGLAVAIVTVAVVALTVACSARGGKHAAPAAKPKIACATGSLTGDGSIVQQRAMQAWITEYRKRCKGATITYRGTGSGSAVPSFANGSVDFAGSENALTADDRDKANARCRGGSAVDLPLAGSALDVSYNLPQLAGNVVHLRARTLAKIFSGEVTRWNDPAIQADNADNQGVAGKLPALAIHVLHRNDDSQPTRYFTRYLDKASGGAWSYGTSEVWPASVGQPVTAGDLPAKLDQTVGAITYLDEPSFWQAFENDPNDIVTDAGLLDSSGGVQLSDQRSVQGALGHAAVTQQGDDITVDLDYESGESEDAYPLVLVTYELACAQGTDSGKQALLESFLAYAASKDAQALLGQDELTGHGDLNGYGPLPESLRTRVATAVSHLN